MAYQLIFDAGYGDKATLADGGRQEIVDYLKDHPHITAYGDYYLMMDPNISLEDLVEEAHAPTA